MFSGSVTFLTCVLMNKTLKMAHMFRLDVADHVVRTVERVAESVLVSSVVQTFSSAWKTDKRKKGSQMFLSKRLLF